MVAPTALCCSPRTSPCRSVATLQQRGRKGRSKSVAPAKRHKPAAQAQQRVPGRSTSHGSASACRAVPGQGDEPWERWESRPHSRRVLAGAHSVGQGVQLPGSLNLSLVFCRCESIPDLFALRHLFFFFSFLTTHCFYFDAKTFPGSDTDVPTVTSCHCLCSATPGCPQRRRQTCPLVFPSP